MHCSDYLLGVCIYDETYFVIETESESTFLRRFLLPILGEIQTFSPLEIYPIPLCTLLSWSLIIH